MKNVQATGVFLTGASQKFVTFWLFSPCIFAAAHTLRCSCGLRLLLCAYALLMRQRVKKNMKQGKVAGRGI